jgi:hypothetical protein
MRLTRLPERSFPFNTNKKSEGVFYAPFILASPGGALICRTDDHRTHQTCEIVRLSRLTHRHELFDEAFQEELAALYASSFRGHPPIPPAHVALAIILQA